MESGKGLLSSSIPKDVQETTNRKRFVAEWIATHQDEVALLQEATKDELIALLLEQWIGHIPENARTPPSLKAALMLYTFALSDAYQVFLHGAEDQATKAIEKWCDDAILAAGRNKDLIAEIALTAGRMLDRIGTRKFAKGLKKDNRGGRKKGSNSTKDNAAKAEEYYRPIISARIRGNNSLSDSDVAALTLKEKHEPKRGDRWLREFAKKVRKELAKAS